MPLIIKDGLKETAVYRRELEKTARVSKCGTGREIEF